jgi:hypothetical protein
MRESTSHLRRLGAAALASICLVALMPDDAAAQAALTIDPSTWSACVWQPSCVIEGATISAGEGTLAQATLFDATGLGVGGGGGAEINIGESLDIDFGQPREIAAIKILFLFNGPEYGDRAEVAQIAADGVTYTLAVMNDADDAATTWNGAGEVDNCGATTSEGTGCFLITAPFAGPVSTLSFTAAPGGPPFAGAGSNDSDFSVGMVDVGPGVVVKLADCADEDGCVVARVNGQVAASFSSLEFTGDEDAVTRVFQPRLPDCRYIPQVCRDMLLEAAPAVGDAAAREFLIGLGVIIPLDPSGPNRLKPAAQRLNVTPLLPAEITSLFDSSGQAPDGLPPLLIGTRWHGQAANDYWFDALFFKTDAGVVFRDTFEGLIDVSKLTGQELGCFAVPGDLLAWDVITTVSETYRSIGGKYIDTMTNTGCINPTRISGTRWSLFPVNLEMSSTTYAPTVRSAKPVVTVNNDAVFARLVQSLWSDIGEARRAYACRNADPVPSAGHPPLNAAVCRRLSVLWRVADLKIDLCVAGTFLPRNWLSSGLCRVARESVHDYAAVLPATATGVDVANRLGEQKARIETLLHVWDTRFLPSIKAQGYCREWNKCAP